MQYSLVMMTRKERGEKILEEVMKVVHRHMGPLHYKTLIDDIDRGIKALAYVRKNHCTSQAARLLGIKRPTLIESLKRHKVGRYGNEDTQERRLTNFGRARNRRATEGQDVGSCVRERAENEHSGFRRFLADLLSRDAKRTKSNGRVGFHRLSKKEAGAQEEI